MVQNTRHGTLCLAWSGVLGLAQCTKLGYRKLGLVHGGKLGTRYEDCYVQGTGLGTGN